MPAADRLTRPAFVLAASAFVIALGLLIRAVNHDEGQYVAAIALMARGLPYRDFAYLQTPLQPLLLSPLSLVAAGWLLLAARVANGLFGLLTVALLYFGLAPFASRRSRAIACAALVATDAFLLASSLARNDALPMLLSTAAVVLLVRGTERPGIRVFALAGLAFGLAASAKLNAALPAAGAGLFLLLRTRSLGPKPLAAFAAGGVAGLLPTLVMAAVAPEQFRFDVFTYNVAAPVQWWTWVGQAGDLSPLHRLLKLVGFAALGATLVALLATLLDRRRSGERFLLELMIAGGLVAAFLPVPFFTQYLVPLLPPLFARFAIALDSLSERWSKRLLILTALGCTAGLANSFAVRFSQLDVLRSPGIAGDVKALAQGGSVATLSPERIAGAGVDLDPRFATGPFLFRTRDRLGQLAEANGHAVTVDDIDAALADNPPAVVLTGGESRPWPSYPQGLDGPLSGWARSHGYREVSLDARFTAFVTPQPRANRR